MNSSQDQIDPIDPQPQFTGQSPAPAPEGQEATPDVSNVCPTPADSSSDPSQAPLWNADEEPASAAQPTQDDSTPAPREGDDSAFFAWLAEAARASSLALNDSKGRKERNEEAICRWVHKAISDPIPGSIRDHYIAYRAWVFQAMGSGLASQALSYSAFCRRVAAQKEYGSALRRVRLKADDRLMRDAAPAAAGHEALWVQALPAQSAASWEPPPTQGMPGTVAIAVDSLTGAVRVDSHIAGAIPSDEVAVSAVQRYEQQHGRAPHVVCVDGNDFHQAPRLARLCHRMGVELRIVHASRSRRRSGPPLTVSPLRLWNASINTAGIDGTGKSATLSKFRSLPLDSQQDTARSRLRDISLARIARSQLRSLRNLRNLRNRNSTWPSPTDDHTSGEEGQ
jgi:hypothetical protein